MRSVPIHDPGIELGATAQFVLPAKPIAIRILLVDDDALVRERLQALLEASGFQVRAVSNGAAALAALRKHFCPVVIVDRDMHDMDGLTLCRTIRNEAFDSYVYTMLLTAHDSETDTLAGLEAGADDYVSKRASSAQLVARLRIAQRILSLEHSLRAVVEEKSRLSTTDVLTGANNRRYFDRHLPVPTSGGAISVSVSIGVCGSELLDPVQPTTVDQLLEIADRCLYQSKHRGRNCVTAPLLCSPTARIRSSAAVPRS